MILCCFLFSRKITILINRNTGNHNNEATNKEEGRLRRRGGSVGKRWIFYKGDKWKIEREYTKGEE